MSQLKPHAQHRAKFMARFKTVHPLILAKAINHFTPGLDWRGCSKGRMADVWASPTVAGHMHSQHNLLRQIPLETIAAKVDVLLGPKREKKRRAAIVMHCTELYAALSVSHAILHMMLAGRSPMPRAEMQKAYDAATTVLDQIEKAAQS